MNRELREALERAGISVGGGDHDGSQVALVQSWGAIPSFAGPAGDFNWNRGFNLLVMDVRGAPTHYVKCRPPSDQGIRREAVVRRALAQRGELECEVPDCWLVETERMALLASHFVSSIPLQRVIWKLRPANVRRTVDSIIVAVEGVVRTATRTLEVAGAPKAAMVDPARPVGSALSDLCAQGLSARSCDAIGGIVAASAALPYTEQHGDLWPDNIRLRGGGRWVLLDFEYFGQIVSPLFDTCHLLRTVCANLRGRAWSGSEEGGWVSSLVAGDAPGRLSRELLEAAARRSGLDSKQTLAALAFYVVAFASRLSLRGNPLRFTQPFVLEAERLGTLISEGRLSGSFFRV